MNRPIVCASARFAVICGVFASVGTAHAAVVISDGTFSDSSWILVPRTYGPNGGSGSGSQVLVGGAGDDGPARFTANSAGPSSSGSYNASIYTGFTYSPAASGSLTDLSISIDARYMNGLSALGAVVEQGGLIWMIGYAINTPTWQTYSFTPASDDWFLINPNGSELGPGPDLSTSGGPMRFGFYTANGTSAGGASYTNSGLNDNFVVSFVPAPAGAAMLCCGGLLGARRRRDGSASRGR